MYLYTRFIQTNVYYFWLKDGMNSNDLHLLQMSDLL